MFKQRNNKSRSFFKSKDDQNNTGRMKRSIQNRWINWEKCWRRRTSCSTGTCVTQTYRFLGCVWSSGLRSPLTSQLSIYQTADLNYSLGSATLSCPENAAICQNRRFLRTRGACFKAKRAHSGGSRQGITQSSANHPLLSWSLSFCHRKWCFSCTVSGVSGAGRARWNIVPSLLRSYAELGEGGGAEKSKQSISQMLSAHVNWEQLHMRTHMHIQS